MSGHEETDLLDIIRNVVHAFTDKPTPFESEQAKRARLWAARQHVTQKLIEIIKASE